jgi:hypothetical protein
MTLAVDVGALRVKVATTEGVTTVPAPAGGPRAAIAATLAAVPDRPRTGLCVAVPEAWLTADVTGAGRREDVRHECEEVAGTGPVTWAGQLAAVAALIAGRGGGDYLVCEVGGTGVRAGSFRLSDGTVDILRTRADSGGGWRDFDVAIRAAVAARWPQARLPEDWGEQAAGQQSRARLVLADYAASPEDVEETHVYRIAGTGSDVDLLAGDVTNSFAPTGRQLRTVIEAVAGAARPDVVVLAGALGWLPLTVRAVADATGTSPVLAGPDAVARGALLFARGQARLAPPTGSPPVTLPAHRVSGGLLEEIDVTLPWTAPFASPPGGAVLIDHDELELAVAGQPRTARLPGVTPGPHLVGVRPTWPGPGVVVVRPADGDRAHIVPLDSLATR